MTLRPARDGKSAGWILSADVDWWTLVRYGPPGFPVYLRVRFLDDDLDDSADEPESTTTALAILAHHTTTPEVGYAAIWEGWGSSLPTPKAPRIDIPHRRMLLFTAPVDLLRNAAALAWRETETGVPPHLAWPADHAWCFACEVDEEIEFSIGCSEEAAEALIAGLPGLVRRVPYGEDAPMYRDDRRQDPPPGRKFNADGHSSGGESDLPA